MYLYQQTVYEETTVAMTEGMTVETSYVPSAYLAEILRLLQALSNMEDILNSPSLQGRDCEDLSRQEECLKVRINFYSFRSNTFLCGQSTEKSF